MFFRFVLRPRFQLRPLLRLLIRRRLRMVFNPLRGLGVSSGLLASREVVQIDPGGQGGEPYRRVSLRSPNAL